MQEQRPPLATLLLIFLLLYSISTTGCPTIPGPSDSSEVTPESGLDIHCFRPGPNNPQITQINYLGQVTNQPYVLRFSITWEDANQDLKGGTYQFLVDDIPLTRHFLPEDDALAQAKGEIELPLVLSPSLTENKPGLRIQLTIWDNDGNNSNQPRMVLEISR